MDRSILVKIFGFPATLIHGDTLVLDRWLWLRRRIPETSNDESLIDVGCGSGAFSIGAARRGYSALGLSWDERNQNIASERATICGAGNAKYEVLDVRKLDARKDLLARFDVAICLENIEHIIDDQKLMSDIAACLVPGGRLLLSTPYLLYIPMTKDDKGPFSTTEDGSHVRRGYTPVMLEELCRDAGLVAERITFCSGMLSQNITKFQRTIAKFNPILGWVIVLPLRILPPLFDKVLTRIFGWPHFSICLEAYKPRWRSAGSKQALSFLGRKVRE